MRVYANKDGLIQANFDGVKGTILWDSTLGRNGFFINDEMDPEKETEKKYFDKRLYDERMAPVEPFRNQRFDAS